MNKKKNQLAYILSSFFWLINKFKKITYKKIINKIIYIKMLKQEKVKDRFVTIYKKNLWSSKESKSGEGSEINQTRNLSIWLVKNIKKFKVNIFVDAPCGDLNWMKKILKKINIKYIGIDIVPPVSFPVIVTTPRW